MEEDVGIVRVGRATVEHLVLLVSQAAMKPFVPQ
jgi:hypothetical protein